MISDRRRRLLGAALAVLAFAALALTPLTASAEGAPAAPTGRHQEADDPQLTLVRQDQVVEPDGTFSLELKVTGAPEGARLTGAIHNPVRSRAEFSRNLFGVKLNPKLRGRAPSMPSLADIPASPDGSLRVPLQVPVCDTATCSGDRISLPTDGVYPLDIHLVDEDGDDLTRLLTFVVRLPEEPDELTPLLTSVLFDRDGPPVLGPDGTLGVDTDVLTPLVLLTTAIENHPDIPITISPTPEMIESIDLGQDNIIDPLALNLRESSSQVVAGTFVDVPTSSWVANGLDRELDAQRARGTEALQKLPEPDISTWVAEPTLDEAAAARLMGLGVSRLVVDPGGLGAGDRKGQLATELLGPFEIDAGAIGSVPAVQIDPGLRDAFTRTPDPILGAHRLLAELAIIAYSADGDGNDRTGEGPHPPQRGVVVAPDPTWIPNEAVLTILLDGITQARPLLQPGTVDQLFTGIPALDTGGGPADDDDKRMHLSLAPQPAAALGDYPTRLSAARRRLDSYRMMIGQGDRGIDRFNDLLLASGAEELAPAQRNAYLDGVVAALDVKFKGVIVPDDQTVTLTSAKGQLPLTIRNTLDEPVNVEVKLQSSKRLEFEGGVPVITQPVTLEANETKTIKVKVRTRVTGDTPVKVVLQTPNGGQELQATDYIVRSTAVSGVGLFLTIGAAGFLALWWLRHIRLVRRERRLLAAEEHPSRIQVA